MTCTLNRSVRVNRRRFITIAAAVTGVSLLPRVAAASAPQTVTWRGVALGAPAMLTLQHPNEGEAKNAISACLAEIARLESIFSLHRLDSALVRLNTSGRLDDAPADLRILIAEALLLAARSEGAFDPTIQPLWQFQAQHAGHRLAAVDAEELARVRALVGWQFVHIEGTMIRFARLGMAMTLNGIAQGYITDKVGDILRAHGFENVLVDLGEQLAVGPKWDGTAWRVGIRDPEDQGRIMQTLPLTSGAVATSSNYTTGTNAGNRFAHILDPRTGQPAEQWSSVTVVSDRATLSDGLSTALTLLPLDRWPALMGTAVRAYAKAPGAEEGFWA
jgi:thiamine biosynthesis lipoprotein